MFRLRHAKGVLDISEPACLGFATHLLQVGLLRKRSVCHDVSEAKNAHDIETPQYGHLREAGNLRKLEYEIR